LNLTIFQTPALSEDTELAIDYISQIVFHPKFEPEKIAQEQQIVIRELADEKSRPDFNDYRKYIESLLGKGPHTYYIGGTEAVLERADSEALREFHARGYSATNSELIITGGLPENIEELVKKYFSDKPVGRRTVFQFPPVQPLREHKIIHTSARELEHSEDLVKSTAQLYLGIIVAPFNLDESPAVDLLCEVLGGSPTSRLFKAVREKKRLTYSINSGYDAQNNKGVLEIHSNILAIKHEEAIDTIFEELSKLRAQFVEPGILEKLRKKKTFEVIQKLESIGSQIDLIEVKLDYNLEIEEYLSKVREVTPQRIIEVANKYLPASRNDGNYVLLLRDPLKMD
jgi:predicted Zn-dependent peptidase